MSDPYRAASKSTQRAVVAAMVVGYVILVAVVGISGYVLPLGAFLLLAVGYVGWQWIEDRRENASG